MSVIQIILIAAIAAVLGLTWRRVGQGSLSRREVLAWSMFWIAAATVVARPEVATLFAKFVGVGRGADAVLYLAVIGLFTLAFRIFLRLEKIERDITALTRIVSLADREARKKDSSS